jgi:hypothetical protein
MDDWELVKKQNASVKRKELTQQKRNRYCSATYYCPYGTGIRTALFLFVDGQRHFSEDDLMTYVDWFMLSSNLSLEEVNFDIDLETCQQIRKSDPYVDWNTVDRSFFEKMCLACQE